MFASRKASDGNANQVLHSRMARCDGERITFANVVVARRKAPLEKQLTDLFAKVGSYYPLRENFRLTSEVKEKFTEKLRRDPAEFLGSKVARIVRTDGLKLVLSDGSWVCYRLSGTETVVCVYSEARSKEALAKLSAAAKAWIFD